MTSEQPRRTVPRRALGALGLGACAAGALGGCGPQDQGFGNAAPVSASADAVPLDKLPENATTLVNFGGERPYVALVRGTGTDVKAMSGYCTHQGCALAVKDAELDCPCHGSSFNATTGAVLSGPATETLPTVKITVDGDVVRRVR